MGKTLVWWVLLTYIVDLLFCASVTVLCGAGTMGGTILWDALVSSCIMLQAQIRGFGVYTNCEVFNDILEEHFEDYTQISDEGKLQIVRSIGCAAVTDMFAKCCLTDDDHAECRVHTGFQS